MSWPATTMRPADGALEPAIISNSVVLPAPFGPITPTISGRCEGAVDVELEGRRAVEQAAAVDLATRSPARAAARRAHVRPPSSWRLSAGIGGERGGLAGPGDLALRQHHHAVGDAERDVGVLLDDDGGDAGLLQAGGSRPARRRRSSAPAPGSARRTASGPARRAARGQSPPSASRRPTASRPRAPSGI